MYNIENAYLCSSDIRSIKLTVTTEELTVRHLRKCLILLFITPRSADSASAKATASGTYYIVIKLLDWKKCFVCVLCRRRFLTQHLQCSAPFFVFAKFCLIINLSLVTLV